MKIPLAELAPVIHCCYPSFSCGVLSVDHIVFIAFNLDEQGYVVDEAD